MLKLFVFVCLVGCTFAFGYEKFFNDYAKMKLMYGCLGQDTMTEYYLSFKNASRECHDENLDDHGCRHNNKKTKRELADQPWSRLTKREVIFDAEHVRHNKEHMELKVNAFLCVLKKLKVTTQNGQYPEIDYDALKDHMGHFEGELKKDFIEGLDHCKKMIDCMPDDKPSIKMAKLHKIIGFFKCNEKCKHMACIKKDLRSLPRDMIDLEGLDGFFKDMDRDDQLAAVVYSETQRVSDFFF